MAQAAVRPTATLGEGVVLGENVVIEENVRIGAGSHIGHGCVVHVDTIIGAGVRVFDNAVLGRAPQRVSSMTRAVPTNLPPLEIGDDCVVGACAVLYRGTTIGAETLIGDLATVREECEIGPNCLIARLVSVNYRTKIGRRVKIMDNTHITGDMIIGDGVFISVLVSTTNDNTMDRSGHGADDFGGPRIERGASIGAGASLLPGVKIGEFAVVGAGSVVCRAVPRRKVVVGNPARVVKDVPPEWIPEENR